MAYTINLTNGTQLLSLADGTSDTSTSMTLIGRNYAGYGTALNTNFVHLLENASSPTAPSSPLVGQLWWDSQGRHLNIWQGTNWKVISSSLTGIVAPANPVTGDFWWNTASNQLYVYGTSQWDLIGPPTAAGTPVTTVVADSVSDGVTQHTVGDLYVNNKLVAVYSTDNSPYTPASSYNGLTIIYPGMNLLPGYSIVGQAIISTNITTANVTVSSQLTTNQLTSTNSSLTNANVITLSANATTTANLTVTNLSNVNALSAVAITSQYVYATTSLTTASVATTGLSATNYTINTGGSFLPATSGINIGSSGSPFATFYGTATTAEYADLAERFASDIAYPVGTVVQLGGTAEITAVEEDLSEDVFGVISTEAAYLMNFSAGTDETHPAIALAGRVPVRVIGKVNKNDRLVSAGNGLARSGLSTEITSFNVFGRALESKQDTGEGVIEAIVRVNI